MAATTRRARQRPRIARTAMAVAGAIVFSLPVTAAAQTIAITGGRVFPVSGPPIDNATVLIRDGRIVAVGANVTVPANAQRVDATGKWVTPGLIDAATQLGAVEIGAVPDTREASARGQDAVAAAFRVSDGLNPASVMITPARNEGVTSVVVVPSGNLVSGQAAFIDLVHGSAHDMVAASPVAMVGEVGNKRAANVSARGELLMRLRELLEDTRAYAQHRAAYEQGNTRSYRASRLDLDAMIPVVQGRLPLLVEADKASDIVAALDLAREFGLKIMIGGGAEAWMVADDLSRAHVPVLTGAMNNIPDAFATLGQRQENAALLQKAGVQVILIGNAGGGDEEAFNVRNIKQEAGNAVAYGLPWDAALRAVTLAPAEAFGVSDRYGSLAPGKVANVVVWSGDPFEFTTRAEHVFVHGEEHREPSRQDMLTERYKTLPPDYDRP
ncbi:MAG TPA: amidohydrolase family protein [Gemmatimonadaceae bacterium]|nr:amidohydrolase family protein [Gemmatimonadaceae bacterium]